MSRPCRVSITEVANMCGVSPETIHYYIDEEWITPADQELLILDEEDIARIDLIEEMKENFDVNDESLAIILHLIDRINLLQYRLKKMQ